MTHRVRTYRAKRERANGGDPDSQSALPFEQQSAGGFPHDTHDSVISESSDPPSLDEDQYEDPLQATLAAAATRISMEDTDPEYYTPASKTNRDAVEHLVIDVSRPAELEESQVVQRLASFTMPFDSQLMPVADISSRRRAGLVDAACLTLAFAGIFGLFAAFGGRLALAKIDAVVCGAIAALLYTQYFTLFTVMGGATPGMMIGGLRLVSFDGTAPRPAQLAWRSFGYLISGGTVFMGFLSTLWDEDQLSWHDRISQTYITSAEALLTAEGHGTPPHAPPA
ncbi:MAG: RDD family protein [Candidatus Acidiferrales bacterium]